MEVLRAVLERGARATPLLSAREEELEGADRGLLRELVLGVLRHRALLDGELAAVCRVPLERLAPNLREILEVGLYQLRHLDRVPAYAAVDEAVRAARASGGAGAARLVNAVLRNALRLAPPLPPGEGRSEGEASATDLARLFSHPPFLVERWLARFGRERTLSVLRANNVPSGLDLMANPRRTDRPTLRRALAEETIATEESLISPLGLSVLSGNPLRSPLLEAGHFTVADVGSQALPLLLPPGGTLVDLAAAPGGKSFASLALGRARRTVSLDRSLARLRLFAGARRRLGWEEALPAAADIRVLPLPDGRFERVLFDAPCSGTGTLRKNPEIRYRVTPEAIERLSRLQQEGIAAAARLLAPGGLLLYSTCSLEEEENERVVRRLLAAGADLELAPMEPPEGLAAHVAGAFFRLFPDERSDGFTAHLLRRKT